MTSYTSGTQCIRIEAEIKACFRVLNATLHLLSKFHEVFFLVSQVSGMTMSE